MLEWVLFDSLYHDFETSYGEPYHRYETWFEYMKKRQHHHRNPSEREEYRLADTCVHGEDGDVTAVVDFFDKKYNRCQEARTREKYRSSHEIKCHLSRLIGNGIHIEEEQCYRPHARECDDEQDEEIGFQRHDS
jgi:hypothetical protein